MLHASQAPPVMRFADLFGQQARLSDAPAPAVRARNTDQGWHETDTTGAGNAEHVAAGSAENVTASINHTIPFSSATPVNRVTEDSDLDNAGRQDATPTIVERMHMRMVVNPFLLKEISL